MTLEVPHRLDTADLEARVKAMYEQVALAPHRGFHFETGRALAEHLGYPAHDLDAVPAAAVESFAGVGYFLDLADVRARRGRARPGQWLRYRQLPRRDRHRPGRTGHRRRHDRGPAREGVAPGRRRRAEEHRVPGG